MKNILEFCGVRYDPEKTDIADAVAPPYDVFNYGDETDRRLRSIPHNIVHIQKPAGSGDDRYSGAARIFEKFMREGILMKEPEPRLYILTQECGGSSRTGIIALVRLDPDYRRIKRHEKVKSGPIEDRLKLTISTGLNIGSIFTVFKDGGAISSEISRAETGGELLYEFSQPDGTVNRITAAAGEKITGMLENETLYIADGHHRYQTMLEYREYMKKETGRETGYFDYTMMYIVPGDQIRILPYHRFIKGVSPDMAAALPGLLEDDYEIERLPAVTEPPAGSIGLYNGIYMILTPRHTESDRLQIEALHSNILEKRLALDEETIKKGDCVHYIPGDRPAADLAGMVDSGKYQLAFLVNPVGLDEVTSRADRGLSMPRKSTFFHPKVPSGLVLNWVTAEQL